MAINLLPLREKLTRSLTLWLAAWLLCALCASLSTVLLTNKFHHQAHVWKKKENQLQKKLRKREHHHRYVLKQQATITPLIQHMEKEKATLLKSILFFTQTLPANIVLSQITYDDKLWTITGSSHGFSHLFNYIRNLKSHFSTTSLTHVQRKNAIDFILTIKH